MKKHDIHERVLVYATAVGRMIRAENIDFEFRKTYCNQLLRSSSSIGANLAEANDAASTKDFVHKVKLSLREARESLYWLKLIHRVELYPAKYLEPLMKENTEIIKILTTIAVNSQKRK